jgi:hypothetical protein
MKITMSMIISIMSYMSTTPIITSNIIITITSNIIITSSNSSSSKIITSIITKSTMTSAITSSNGNITLEKVVNGSQEEGHSIKAGVGGRAEGVAMDGVLGNRTGVHTLAAGAGESMVEGGGDAEAAAGVESAFSGASVAIVFCW